MSAQATARLLVSGEVQGVAFRFWTRRKAEAAGVRGWVRNLPDGTVEAVVQGDRPAVDSVIAWCRKGPAAAAVTEVETEWVHDAPEFTGFAIRY